jgi:hypothetical protein
MDSRLYDDAKKVKFGPVDLVGKMKSCGKENCSGCPHGPFWYAYVAATDAADQTRCEIYLGSGWMEADLREKVAPRLFGNAHREFLTAVSTVVRSERIAWLEREEGIVHRAINDVAARAQKEIAKLRRDEFGIKKELRELRSKG